MMPQCVIGEENVQLVSSRAISMAMARRATGRKGHDPARCAERESPAALSRIPPLPTSSAWVFLHLSSQRAKARKPWVSIARNSLDRGPLRHPASPNHGRENQRRETARPSLQKRLCRMIRENEPRLIIAMAASFTTCCAILGREACRESRPQTHACQSPSRFGAEGLFCSSSQPL